MLTREDYKEIARVIKTVSDAELKRAEAVEHSLGMALPAIIAAGALAKLADAFMEAARQAPTAAPEPFADRPTRSN